MKLGDSGYRQNVSKKHQERTWLLVLPDKKGLRGGRLYGGQLVKVGSLWGSRERERGLLLLFSRLAGAKVLHLREAWGQDS